MVKIPSSKDAKMTCQRSKIPLFIPQYPHLYHARRQQPFEMQIEEPCVEVDEKFFFGAERLHW